MKKSAAGALLNALKATGISYVFCNPGSDFAPIIEELAANRDDNFPALLTVADERLAPALAHGYYLATGQMQAIMVHVNVGLANTVIGLINARSDDIPLFVLSGRTPLTTGVRTGAKDSPIQYGQEMYDQTSLVRELVKWEFELRYPETVAELVGRATSIAKTAPCGPVYLSLPREPLTQTYDSDSNVPTKQYSAGASIPTPDQIQKAEAYLRRSKRPLIICQRSDQGGIGAKYLSEFASTHQIPVAEIFATRNVMASNHPCYIGNATPEVVAQSDVIFIIDAAVPWIQSSTQLSPNTRVIHLGPDPLFQRLPTRAYQSDLVLTGDVAASMNAMQKEFSTWDNLTERTERLAALRQNFLTRKDAATKDTTVLTKPMVAKTLSKFLNIGDRVFSERGAPSPFYDLPSPNMFFGNTHAGGLGWSFPAALGAQLANSNQLNVCVIGDGGYMLSNPTACHHFAEANALPVLTIVLNNRAWGAVASSTQQVFPEGAASRVNKIPLVSIDAQPDFCKIAKASNAWAQNVKTPDDLEPAIVSAIEIIRNEKRQVLLDIHISD